MWSMLTADHGGLDLPERSREQAGGGARVDPALNARDDGRGARPRGSASSGPVLFGDGAVRRHLYRPRLAARGSAPRVLAEAIAAYRAHPQVAAVFTRAEIAATPLPSGPPDCLDAAQRARASFDAAALGRFLRDAEAADHADRRRRRNG